ncbi:MAG: hypothetical protein RLZZ08_1077 [Pseudomonadota bacterium]
MKIVSALVFSAAAIIAQPALAQAADPSAAHDGLRLETRATWETPTVSSVLQNNDVYKLGSAFAFGGEAGFDLAVSHAVVVGPYVTYEKSNVDNCDGTDCLSAKDNVAGGLEVGYAVGKAGQLYGKLGYASLSLEATLAGDRTTESGSGVEFAIGYEHALSKTFYGRVEFGYADNGQIMGINFQRRHAGLSLGARF